jgi:hypothetical protein
MAGFVFRLETPEGIPAHPPTMASVVPSWKAGAVSEERRRSIFVNVREGAPE